jgi:hypothetical protein
LLRNTKPRGHHARLCETGRATRPQLLSTNSNLVSGNYCRFSFRHDHWSQLCWQKTWLDLDERNTDFWKTENLGQDNATARVKFSLSEAPGIDYQDPKAQRCTTIPVSECDADKSTQDTLGMQMVLSLDTTLSAAFAGALFATNAAVIGSLDVSSGETPSLTYGIAGPHRLSDGTVRKGKFYGFLSDAVLESQFKIAATETDMTKVLSVARTAESKSTADAGTDTVAWTKWSAADNGTDGRLVTISDISFSAPKFKVTKVGSGTFEFRQLRRA